MYKRSTIQLEYIIIVSAPVWSDRPHIVMLLLFFHFICFKFKIGPCQGAKFVCLIIISKVYSKFKLQKTSNMHIFTNSLCDHCKNCQAYEIIYQFQRFTKQKKNWKASQYLLTFSRECPNQWMFGIIIKKLKKVPWSLKARNFTPPDKIQKTILKLKINVFEKNRLCIFYEM